MAGEIKTFDEITGTTAFLEGHKGLPGDVAEFYDYLVGIGKPVLLIENLYEEPANIAQIRSCQNICFFTTGMFVSKLNQLVTQFDSLDYVPLNVFFTGWDTALLFRGHVEKLSAIGTRFYFLNVVSKKLEAMK